MKEILNDFHPTLPPPPLLSKGIQFSIKEVAYRVGKA